MRIAVVGAGGQLGSALMQALAGRDAIPLTRADFDLGDRAATIAALEAVRPDVIILAGAMTDLAAAERDPDAAFRVNALGARWVAQSAERMGAGLLYVSTDYVFSGDGGAPYDEWAPTSPLSVYGRSKLAGEEETAAHCRRSWVVRTSWIFGGAGRTFPNTIRRLAAEGKPLRVVADEIGGPTFAPDLAAALVRLIDLDAPGRYHLANEGECSRFELARATLELSGSNASVEPVTSAAFGPGGLRPLHSTLANRAAAALGVTLRPWREALAEHLCASP